MLRKFKNHFRQYSEIFYMLYFIPLVGCVSMNISSSQLTYLVVFACSLVFLLIKLILTDYSKKEIILMTIVLTLLGYIFFRTREKTLIITTISIFGCKDVNIKRVLKYAFFVYIIGMSIMACLVLLGQVQGKLHYPVRNGIKYTVNDFGYSHPNSVYNHLLIIVLMAVSVWEEKIRWYQYGIITIVMFLAYIIFMSRTGILIYLLLCVMLASLRIIKRKKVKAILAFFWSLIPLVMAVLSYVLTILYSRDISIINKLNDFVNRRIKLPAMALDSVGLTWFGAIEKTWIGKYYVDNVYMNILLSCGIIVCVLCVVSYFLMCYYYWSNESYYILLILGIIAIYMFMEYAVVNVTWNPLLLFMSGSIFKSPKETKPTEYVSVFPR
ncbi:hypothetical protein [Lacrimispora sp.]|uniref:hypothetical protein n=1 Tax=Lacrimispora sp. TaxID=2719234 RepID=UPI003460F614